MPGAFASMSLDECRQRLESERRSLEYQARFVAKIERRIAFLEARDAPSRTPFSMNLGEVE